MTMACYVLAVCFWVLAALCFVSLSAFVYVQVQYYRWDKEDREAVKLAALIAKELSETENN